MQSVYTRQMFNTAQALKRVSALRLITPPSRSTSVRTLIDARRIATPQSHVVVDRLAAYTRDNDIRATTVRVKGEDGLGPPEQLSSLLQNLDRKVYTVVQLSSAQHLDNVVVRICAKSDLLKEVRDNEERSRRQELASKEKKPKQIELNWAISENDLNLKLKQLEQFLNKGKKVEILLAAKRKQRKATPEEGESVLTSVRRKIQEVGAREITPMEGHVLKQATLFVKK